MVPATHARHERKAMRTPAPPYGGGRGERPLFYSLLCSLIIELHGGKSIGASIHLLTDGTEYGISTAAIGKLIASTALVVVARTPGRSLRLGKQFGLSLHIITAPLGIFLVVVAESVLYESAPTVSPSVA